MEINDLMDPNPFPEEQIFMGWIGEPEREEVNQLLKNRIGKFFMKGFL